MKRYADEDGAELVRSLESLVVSDLCRVEVPAAIWRKTRAGELDPGQAGVLVRAFEAEMDDQGSEARFVSVGVTASVIDAAATATGIHGLRAYDAVQLASAMAARGAVGGDWDFAAFDRDLRAAAARTGFALVPATSRPVA